jgi:hypothetical protein
MNAINLTADVCAVFIDDTHAAASETAAWTMRLNEAGVSSAVVASRGRQASQPLSRLGARLLQRSPGGTTGVGRPVVIGRGDAAVTVARLLHRGAATAAVLIAADRVELRADQPHPPLLILDARGARGLRAEGMRANGICDQRLVEASRDDLLRGESGIDLAHYIQGWLDFHQLISH